MERARKLKRNMPQACGEYNDVKEPSLNNYANKLVTTHHPAMTTTIDNLCKSYLERKVDCTPALE